MRRSLILSALTSLITASVAMPLDGHADRTTQQRVLSHNPEAEAPPMPKPPLAYSPWFGGIGGSSGKLECRDAENRFNYIGGIVTDIGRVVQGLALSCLDTMGNWVGQTYPVGGTWMYPIEMRCPMGSYPFGFHGKSGQYIDSLGVLCTNNGKDLVSMPADRGGPGGGRFEWTCPEHHSLAGINFRAGEYLDAIQAYCRFDPP